MKVRDFSKLYFAFLILHLAVIYQPESRALYVISKPLLAFSLLAFFVHRTAELSWRGKSFVPLALMLCLIGDLLLLGEGRSFFLAGMAAFALGHLAFTGFYLKQEQRLPIFGLILSVILIGGGLYILYRYVHAPQDLEPFLYGYGLILGVHLIWSSKLISVRLPYVGVLLFIVSDILLAFNEFNESNKYLHMAVMLTYGLAQYSIALGLINYIEARARPIERPSE